MTRLASLCPLDTIGEILDFAALDNFPPMPLIILQEAKDFGFSFYSLDIEKQPFLDGNEQAKGRLSPPFSSRACPYGMVRKAESPEAPGQGQVAPRGPVRGPLPAEQDQHILRNRLFRMGVFASLTRDSAFYGSVNMQRLRLGIRCQRVGSNQRSPTSRLERLFS